MSLRVVLQKELNRRQARNPRYSQRAFARDLSIHHSTLSRILRGRQHGRPGTLSEVAARLRLTTEFVFQTGLSELESTVLDAIRRPGFRPDSRWIASVTGVPLDEVNAALHRLLRKRRLSMVSADVWVT